MNRIEDKIEDIKEFLEQLGQIAPGTLREYKSKIEKRAACERFAEKIIEAITDLAFLAIKIKKLQIPADDIDAFNILSENKIIPEALAEKLRNAKGMRNILAHQYGKTDDEIVFNAIKEELGRDAGEFVKKIRQVMK